MIEIPERMRRAIQEYQQLLYLLRNEARKHNSQDRFVIQFQLDHADQLWAESICEGLNCRNEARYTSNLCGLCDLTLNGGKGRRYLDEQMDLNNSMRG